MKKKKKTQKWIKFRHKVITKLARGVLAAYTENTYGVKVEPFAEQNGRQYLVLLNHQTPFDQFFVGMAFDGPVYYMATEDIFSLGWISSLLRWAVAPIPIKKQTTDLTAVANCMKVVKEGGTIAIAVEGNRTYSGKTEYINPAIAKMVRRMKVPVALFRIEGGYGTQPRWGDGIRKGSMRAYISEVIEPEEMAGMSEEALYKRITEGLYVDDTEIGKNYYYQKSAEYLERAIYVCPDCGLSEFVSCNDIVMCKKCGQKVRYLPSLTLEGVNGQFPFTHVSDWYEYQKKFINQLDTGAYVDAALYHDQVRLSEVIVNKHKKLLRKEAEIALYGDRIVVDEGCKQELVFPFSEVTALSVLGKNKANIYHDKKVYQIKGSKRFNALKYVNIYYRFKNVAEGNNGEFLGL